MTEQTQRVSGDIGDVGGVGIGISVGVGVGVGSFGGGSSGCNIAFLHTCV